MTHGASRAVISSPANEKLKQARRLRRSRHRANDSSSSPDVIPRSTNSTNSGQAEVTTSTSDTAIASS